MLVLNSISLVHNLACENDRQPPLRPFKLIYLPAVMPTHSNHRKLICVIMCGFFKQKHFPPSSFCETLERNSCTTLVTSCVQMRFPSFGLLRKHDVIHSKSRCLKGYMYWITILALPPFHCIQVSTLQWLEAHAQLAC